MKKVRKISKKYYLRQIMACFLACYMLFGMPIQIARAAPTGGTFTEGGTGTIIDGIQDSSVTVNQAVSFIDWDSFDTSSTESVTFLQGLMSNSAVLNRISGDKTQFDGLLSAVDMRIFLLNPAGIIFGEGSSVNANQLVASSMKMTNDAFFDAVTDADNDLVFTNPSSYEGDKIVANYGTINAADSVYLVGKNVLNAGTIITNPGGLVAMVAGDEMVLGQPGSPTIVKTLKVNHIENHTVDNGAIGGTSSNLYDQFGIDASGNTGTVSTGELVLAAGDVWSNAVENVQDLTAVARGDIHFEEAINITGDLKAQAGLTTQYDSEWDHWTEGPWYWRTHYYEEVPVEVKIGGDVHAKDTIDAGGSIDVLANGIQFDADVSAGPDADDNMTLTGRWGEDPIDGFHDIVTAGLTAGGNIDISVTGVTNQKVWEYDDWDEVLLGWYHTGQWVGNSTPTYEPGTITLNGDVAAIAGNLTISNTTDVTLPATLSAGTDLVLKNSSDPYENAETLTGTDSLALVAGNEIQAGDTTISVTGSELTLQQGPTLDTADFLFGLQGTTHLTLISDKGSVFSTDTADGGKDENAADQWASIGATANGGIILSGHESNINARRLEAAHGPIDIDAKTNDILANDHGFTGDDGILASGGGNITLTGNNVIVDGDIDAHYGLGIRPVGYNSDLTVEAEDDIELDGYANVDGDMVLRANMTSGDGDMTATGNLIAGGSIDIYSSDTTTFLGGDLIEATDDITLHNDTELDGGILQRIKALTGQLYANGSVRKTTTGDLEMFGGYNGPLYPDMDYSVKTQDVTVDDGELSIAGNATVKLEGSIYSKGKMTLASNADGIASTPSQAPSSSSPYSYDQLIHSSGTIQSLNGDIDLSAQGSTISLNGGYNPTDPYVSAGGDILIRNYTWVQESRKLKAVDDIVLAEGKRLQGMGSLSLVAGDDIIIGSTDVDNHWLAPEDDTGVPSEVKTNNGDLILNAGDDVYVHGELITLDGSGGDIEITASDDTIHLYGNVTADQTDGGDIILHNNTEVADGVKLDAGHNVEAFGTLYGHGSLTALADNNIKLKDNAETVADMKLDAGNSIKADRSLTSGGKLNALAGTGNIELGGHVQSTDIMKLNAGNNITADKSLTSGFKLVADAGNNIEFNAHVESVDNMNLYAGNDIKTEKSVTSTDGKLNASADHNIEFGGDYGGHAYSADTMNLYAGNNIKAYKSVKTGGKLNAESGWNIEIAGDVESTDNMNLDAGNKIEIDNKITSGGKLTALADNKIIFHRWAQSEDDMLLDAGNDVYAYGDLTSINGSIDIYSSDWTTYLGADVTAAVDVTLHNNTKLIREWADQTVEAQNGTVTAEGWVWKTTDGHLYLIGNNDDPEHRDGKAIDLQYAGCLPAASTCLGNLELLAPNGDIQISGDLTTFGLCCGGEPGPRLETSNGDGDFLDGWYNRPTGGVSVIAENGKIYTEGASPENDTLNIGIVGNSDQLEGLGVDLPYQDDEPSYEIPNGYETTSIEIERPETKKAAIVVMSNEDLKFGPDTMLIAKGTYDDSVVDDRAAVNFLDTPDTMIGGVTRDEGDAIDVAVYLASTEGDVHLDGRAIDVAEGGTMVVDAYDTVTFGDFDTFNFDNFDLSGDDFDSCVDFGCLMIKLMLRFGHDIMEDFTCDDLELAAIDYFGDIDAAHTFLYDLMNDPEANKGTLSDFLNFFFGDGYFFNIDRLEVVSRVTEWLSQASSNGTLPYAGNAGAIAAFEAFIGGDYIMRGAGLGNPEITDGRAWVLENPPIPEPLDVVQAPQISGCPAAMEAVANELAIGEGTLQISIGGMLALNPTIQPCSACAGLLDTAAILRDEDGSRMAALNQVFNEVAPANVPFSPVMATSIVTAFADQVDDGSQSNYATAMEYIDAFVQYVAILDTQLGSPVEDSTAFVMAKYGAGITESENSNIAAFVAARLAGLESF